MAQARKGQTRLARGEEGNRWKNVRPSVVAVPVNSAIFLTFFSFWIKHCRRGHTDHHPLPPKRDNNVLQHVYWSYAPSLHAYQLQIIFSSRFSVNQDPLAANMPVLLSIEGSQLKLPRRKERLTIFSPASLPFIMPQSGDRNNQWRQKARESHTAFEWINVRLV